MPTLTNFQNAVPAIDYFSNPTQGYFATVLAVDYQARLDSNGGSDTFAVTDSTGATASIKVIIDTDAPQYYPLTSLVDGKVYSITVDDSGRPPWMTPQQGVSFNAWQPYHLKVFSEISAILTSTNISMAQALFENPLNGLNDMLNAFLADQASPTPSVALTDIIPDSSPKMTWGRWLLGILAWNAFEQYLSTAIDQNGTTPQMILTAVEGE